MNSSQNIEITEIKKREDRDGKSKENMEVRRTEDANLNENISEEHSYESSEEETSELDLPAPLGNTRRNLSPSTAKAVDVVTRPDDKAGQNIGIKIGYFNSQHTRVYVR